MDKIASPQDLTAELQTLLASCQDGASREKLASDLRGLADRVAGLKDGPVGRALDRHWNTFHDLEDELLRASSEYDTAASYRGKPGERPAQKMMKQVQDAIRAIKQITNSGGVFDKLFDTEAAFVKKFGEPSAYSDKIRREIYPR